MMIVEPLHSETSIRIPALRDMMEIHLRDLMADAIAEGWEGDEIVIALNEVLKECDVSMAEIGKAGCVLPCVWI